MKNKEKRQLDNNFIEQQIAKAFGYSDEQLASELDRFMEEAEKSDDKALEAPEGEFERIWNRLEREHDEKRHKGIRVKKMAMVMAVAAVLGTVLFGGSMWVGAKRHYVYEVREREDLENVIVLNNSSDNLITDDFLEEEKAYDQIRDELNIDVLELSYLPEKMVFKELKLFRNKGKMEFVQTPKWLYFYQGFSDKPASLSYASDMKIYKYVYNSFLDIEIPIYKKELENEKVEYSVRIIEENYYYIVEGVIDIEEFEQVVYGIKLYEG
ncbi:MAG: hypothetical protein HFG72_12575 [Hungatella sp.]|nr:hypothetical protein [Hungatella sp.]